MNLVVFDSPCGRIIDHEIEMTTVPVEGDKIEFPRHGVFEVKGRRFDILRRKWMVAVFV